MINLDSIKTAPKAESDGAWFNLRCGMRVKIARVNSPAYNQRMQELMEPYASILRARQPLPAGVAIDIARRCVAETVIRDWDPVEYGGKKLEYSPENALLILGDEKLHDISDEITTIATSADCFRASVLEDAEKN